MSLILSVLIHIFAASRICVRFFFLLLSYFWSLFCVPCRCVVDIHVCALWLTISHTSFTKSRQVNVYVHKLHIFRIILLFVLFVVVLSWNDASIAYEDSISVKSWCLFIWSLFLFVHIFYSCCCSELVSSGKTLLQVEHGCIRIYTQATATTNLLRFSRWSNPKIFGIFVWK